MIDLAELKAEIERLEDGEMSQTTCNKLAALYCVLDHQHPAYLKSGSEFAMVISQKPFEAVLPILEEHFEAIKVLYPKEYSAIIRKIKEISP